MLFTKWDSKSKEGKKRNEIVYGLYYEELWVVPRGVVNIKDELKISDSDIF